MHIQQFQASDWLKGNWFFLAALFVVLADVYSLNHMAAYSPGLLETALLCDLAVVLPCLYLVCYRRHGKKAIVRALALACLGIWVASILLPTEAQHVINYLWPFRYAGIAVLVVLELKIVFAIYRAVFGGDSVEQTATALQDKTELPAWVVRLVALEAAFWHRVVSAITRLFGRNSNGDSP